MGHALQQPCHLTCLACVPGRYNGTVGSYPQMKSASNYIIATGRVYGWWPVGCTTTYDGMCEFPMSLYQCPPAPPPSPPAITVSNNCELLTKCHGTGTRSCRTGACLLQDRGMPAAGLGHVCCGVAYASVQALDTTCSHIQTLPNHEHSMSPSWPCPSHEPGHQSMAQRTT